MKKIPYRKKLWLDRKSRQGSQRRKTFIKLPKTRSFGNIYWAPKILCVYGPNGHELVNFIEKVKSQVIEKKKTATLNCSKIAHIYPPGAILLYAELNRIVEQSGLPKPLKIIPPQSDKCKQVFKQLEFLKLSQDDATNIDLNRDDVIYWRCTTGSDQSGDGPGNFLERVAGHANEIAKREVLIENIWPGVSEAINNTTEHAYPTPSLPTSSKKWWLLTSVRKNRFAAAVCDLGVGYRETTPQTIPERFVNSFKAKFSEGINKDALAIHLAMEYGRSRTGQKNRGKGSRDAQAVISKHGEGELVIISHAGSVRYEYKINKNTPKPEVTALSTNINATIIWWSLPLTDEGNESD